jgi:hypothetical protein
VNEITDRRKINYYYIMKKKKNVDTMSLICISSLMTTLLKHFLPLVGSRIDHTCQIQLLFILNCLLHSMFSFEVNAWNWLSKCKNKCWNGKLDSSCVPSTHLFHCLIEYKYFAVEALVSGKLLSPVISFSLIHNHIHNHNSLFVLFCFYSQNLW